jgi:S1-C subfamily serine protease
MKRITLAAIALANVVVFVASAAEGGRAGEAAKPCATCKHDEVVKGPDGWPTGLRLGAAFISAKDDPASPRKDGVKILHLQPGGAGERGGLKPGDVVIAVDQKAIHTQEELAAELRLRKIGETLHFSVLRDAEKLLLSVKF